MKHTTHTEQGARDYQEDTFLVLDALHGLQLYAVFDGLGGYSGGKVCATEAKEGMLSFLHGDYQQGEYPTLLDLGQELLLAAREGVKKTRFSHQVQRESGTTVVMLLVDSVNDEWVSLAVGDSRFLVVDKQDVKTEPMDLHEGTYGGLTAYLACNLNWMSDEDYSRASGKLSDVKKFVLATDGVEFLPGWEDQAKESTTAEALVAHVLKQEHKFQDNVTVVMVDNV